MVPTLCIPHDEASKRSSAIWNVISHMLAPFVKSLFSKILLCHFRSKYFLLRTGFMFTTPHLENNLCFLFWSQNMRLKKKLLCWRKKIIHISFIFMGVVGISHVYRKFENKSVAIFFRVGISHDMEDLRRSSESRLDLPD